jgi:hypothetical protein
MIPAAKLREIGTDKLEELNRAVIAELRVRYTEKQRLAMASLRIGSRVKWFSEKRGREVEVVVTGFNRKTISGHEVGMPLKTWRVSPSLVEVVPTTAP